MLTQISITLEPFSYASIGLRHYGDRKCPGTKWDQGINIYCVDYILSHVLLWRQNGRDGVSNHQPHVHLLNRSFRRRSKKTAKLGVTDLCEGNSPVTGEFPAQVASNAENASIWWRHHILTRLWQIFAWIILSNRDNALVFKWYSRDGSSLSVYWRVRHITAITRSALFSLWTRLRMSKFAVPWVMW